jgi:hypothetical protein
VVEFGLNGTETDLDIAETFSISQLSEGHTEKLIQAGKTLNLVMPPISFDTFAKLRQREEVDQLRENGLSNIHGPFLSDLRKKNGPSIKAI